ncbi:MAG: histidinol-phosphate transaminase [Rhodothermales bacterium]|nr:histidinol-phosphate transaminase [Rhodothermales bacterium]
MPPPPALDAVLDQIRPAIRREQPYLVATPPGVDVKLNQNECPYDCPEELKRELVETFLATPFNRYPASQPDRLQAALAEAAGHDPAGVLVGNGSNELTHTLGLALIGPGTPAVLPRPMFALYESVVRMHEGALTAVPPRPDLRFDAEAILAAVQRERPAMTVLTTPNNPTGLAMPLDEIAPIVEAAAPGVVVVDEAYVEFTEEESAQVLLPSHPNLLLMRTLSKAYGLAGLRVGYLMGHPALVGELLKARLPFMVDPLAEATALALLARPALLQRHVEAMKTSCKQLTAALAAMPGVEVVPSQANFVIFSTGEEPRLLVRRLADRGVLIRDMSGYPALRAYVRVNAGTPAENQAFLVALKDALDSEHDPRT